MDSHRRRMRQLKFVEQIEERGLALHALYGGEGRHRQANPAGKILLKARQQEHLIVDRKEHVIALGGEALLQELQVAERVAAQRWATMASADKAAEASQAKVRVRI